MTMTIISLSHGHTRTSTDFYPVDLTGQNKPPAARDTTLPQMDFFYLSPEGLTVCVFLCGSAAKNETHLRLSLTFELSPYSLIIELSSLSFEL